MFPTDSTLPRITLHEYFDATRAPGDRGHFNAYQAVINQIGQTADKQHYIKVRQEGRNNKLRAQYVDTVAAINVLEGQIAADLLAKK